MPDLGRLGRDLAAIDALIIDLAKRRMDIATLVIAEKIRNKKEGERPKIYRKDIEKARLKAIKKHAKRIGLDPNFARSLLYSLIGESCKTQIKQLEKSAQLDLETLDGEVRRRILKDNLLRLTERVAENYDDQYSDDHLATKAYLRFEEAELDHEIAKLPNCSIAMDLGCGTGRVSLRIARRFDEIHGYDLSSHMLYRANTKRDKAGQGNVSFTLLDLEADDIPLKDGSASFAIMNLGTASDIPDLPTVLCKMTRALEPGGRFFLSFYNADALVYKFGFLPWPTSLAAALDPYTNCLNVQVDDEAFPIFARPYTESEIRNLLPTELEIDRIVSYPLLSSILPDDFYRSLPDPSVVDGADQMISASSSGALNMSGAYLLVCGRKLDSGPLGG